ncbi:MAG: thioether cross-link-forming SCIFF peptide maturase [Lachnospiraceae bacterium]|nr:thioether cross-link-forming SCIFF peptide maturase [Lachnospiraceae bacterium]
MVHQFKNNGYNIVLDVESGAIHEVDDIAYEMIASYKNFPKKELFQKISELFPDLSEGEFEEIYGEIVQLEKEGSLFTEGDYEERMIDFSSRPVVVKALCLHVAHDCNLSCRYCFAEEGKYHGQVRELMDFETGKQALDFLVAHSGSRRHLEVDFFGGEPLLNFEVVKRLVAYGRSIEKENDKEFRFTLTTNGVLLNEDVLEFANRELSNVVLSLDGRQGVNDAMRPFRGKDKRGSYDTIVPKFQQFVKGRKGTYYVRGTYTRENLDFSKDVLHLFDLGFDQISVEPVVAPQSEVYAIQEEDLLVLYDEYDALAAEMARRAGTKDDFTFFHFMIDLEGGPCVYKRLSGCGSGTEYLAAAPGGDLYPCHQFVGQEGFRLGSVYSGIEKTDLVDKFKSCNVYAKKECRDCFARFYCSGGCAANAFHASGDINGVYEIGCKLQRKRVECAIMLQVAKSHENESSGVDSED